MWHSMAMAASDISLLDSETAPLRVYVQELRPTPENNLEIILRKRWVCPRPGLGPAGRGVGDRPGRGQGRVLMGAGSLWLVPSALVTPPRAPGRQADHTGWPQVLGQRGPCGGRWAAVGPGPWGPGLVLP